MKGEKKIAKESHKKSKAGDGNDEANKRMWKMSNLFRKSE